MIACWNGKTAEAKRLIAEGAPVDWQNGDGWAPLHEASQNGRTEIVMLLLENKCNLNVTDKKGDTPLIYAAYWNKMDTVRALVEAGCDITIRGFENKTAAEWAKDSRATTPSQSTSLPRPHSSGSAPPLVMRVASCTASKAEQRAQSSGTFSKRASFPLAHCPSSKSSPPASARYP